MMEVLQGEVAGRVWERCKVNFRLSCFGMSEDKLEMSSCVRRYRQSSMGGDNWGAGGLEEER